MAEIISIINMKGGVGKTTLSIGIADYLAGINKQVLVIDADPQFNATQALLDCYKPSKDDEENFYTDEIKNNGKTVFKLFKIATDLIDQEESLPTSEELIVNLKSGLDIICGDLNLVLVNKFNDHSNLRKIKNFIEDNKLKEKYDYIIIDCPPTLTIYTESALMASDYYLIPNRIDRYSIVGIDSLQRAIKHLVSQERIDLKCIGLVYTMIESNMPVKQQKLKNDFESKSTVETIDVFTSSMRIVNNIPFGKSGSLPTKYKNSLEDIEAICVELVDKIEKDKFERGKE